MTGEKLLFCAWWVGVNQVTCLLSLDFLTGIAGGGKRRFTFLYMAVNGVIAGAVTLWGLHGLQLLDMAVLLLFGRVVLKYCWRDMAAPAAILFTLTTLLEGFSAVAMSWISKNVNLEGHGFLAQMTVSLVMELVFFSVLVQIRRRYLSTLNQPVSSLLYMLLWPCGFTVLAVRYGLKLDDAAFEAYLASFGTNATAAVCVMMTATAAVFFVMIRMFCKILQLVRENQEAEVLKSQVEGQKIYIEEARKRNEKYVSFRHDLDNHLLVLSGLMRQQKYDEALEYAGELKGGGEFLSVPVNTGNPALDVLLQEKFSFAERSGIQTACDVEIPEDFAVEDMDLCTVAANIMDNGIRACLEAGADAPYLSISTRSRGGFLVIESVNTAPKTLKVKPGIGLGNIHAIARKYQGTVETESGGGIFRISVLLCPE